MYKLEINGRRFDGTPLAVIEQMQATAFGADTMSPAEFMQSTAEAMNIEVDGSQSPEMQATELITKMIAAGNAKPQTQ